MKFRGATRFGGVSYYSLIGAAHLGSRPEIGDAQIGAGNTLRDLRLLRNVKTARQGPEDHPSNPQLAPTDGGEHSGP